MNLTFILEIDNNDMELKRIFSTCYEVAHEKSQQMQQPGISSLYVDVCSSFFPIPFLAKWQKSSKIQCPKVQCSMTATVQKIFGDREKKRLGMIPHCQHKNLRESVNGKAVGGMFLILQGFFSLQLPVLKHVRTFQDACFTSIHCQDLEKSCWPEYTVILLLEKQQPK